MDRRLSVLALLAALSGYIDPVSAQSSWTRTLTLAHPKVNATFVDYLPPEERLSVVVTLRLRNRAQLDSVVESLITPGTPTFRQWLSHEEIVSNYLPTQDQVEQVASYLARMNFVNIAAAPNRMLITADGTAGAVRTAFNTDLAHFRRGDRVAIANTGDVQIPASLGQVIGSVLGLQELDQLHTMVVSTHIPTQWPTIYDAGTVSSAANTVVGVITEGSMTQTISDLHTFESQNGLPTINPTVVNVGGSSNDTSNTIEWNLDSQDIQAMAGGQLGGMIFYTAPSLTNAALTNTLNAVVTANAAKVINMSLGECETAAQSDGSMAADDSIFELAIAQGQTFAVSSGDLGSYECGTGGVNGVSYGSLLGDSYPASSPYVVAVGGTTLSTNSNGTYASETTWAFGGGGPSSYEPKPSWQAGVVPGTTRGVPDVSFTADPASGALIIVNGSQVSEGGTSLAAPLFVGAWARLESAHHNSLGFPSGWLYSRGAASPEPLMFHDVTTGSNGAYSAAAGWDYATGLGSLDIAKVNAQLSSAIVPIINFLLQ